MPKSPTQQMSAALKAVLVPVLQEAGFDGRFPRYRRDRAEVLHFIGLQYDKTGTSFFLEAAWHPPGDKTTSWGELVPQHELLLEHAPLEHRVRLQRHGGASSLPADWFSYEGLGDDAAAYRALAASVAGLLPQVEAWLARGEVGVNISPFAAR
ncbi:DUF4304 domain-containing protein [Variovorax paradoxus]|uniref:DUF4304 domain-containing protein n=1 Tax=Variovorax paradoxus TaxID=34073 RepID=UPI001ABC32DF